MGWWFHMLIEKSHILLSLLAALALTIAGLIVRMPLVDLAFWMIVTLVFFYIVGLFLRGALRKNIASKVNANTQSKNNEESNGQQSM